MTNENENYIPSEAIIVYRSSKDVYLETRKINDNFQLGAGTPFSDKEYKKLANSIGESLNNSFGTKGIMPNNVLHFSQSNGDIKLIWFVRSKERTLYFDDKSEIPSGRYVVPHLIFKAENNNISVYAVKRVDINEKTNLYKAPFPNVYNDGSVCIGNVKVNSE